MKRYSCDRCGKDLGKDITMSDVEYCPIQLSEELGNRFELCSDCKTAFIKAEASARLRYRKELLNFFNIYKQGGRE